MKTGGYTDTEVVQMAVAVLFLLLGMLGSEVTMFGIDAAGIAGAALLLVSAGLLIRLWFAEHEARRMRPAVVSTARPRPMGSREWQATGL